MKQAKTLTTQQLGIKKMLMQGQYKFTQDEREKIFRRSLALFYKNTVALIA